MKVIVKIAIILFTSSAFAISGTETVCLHGSNGSPTTGYGGASITASSAEANYVLVDGAIYGPTVAFIRAWIRDEEYNSDWKASDYSDPPFPYTGNVLCPMIDHKYRVPGESSLRTLGGSSVTGDGECEYWNPN